MNRWDIDINGVSIVLTDVQTQLGVDGGGLSTTITQGARALDDALESAKSPVVEAELLRFVSHYSTTTDRMYLRGLSCLKGASDATNEFIAGNTEMARTAELHAGTTFNLDIEGTPEPPPNMDEPR